MVNKAQIEYDLMHYFEDAVSENSFTTDQYVIRADGVVQVQADVGRKRKSRDGFLPLKFNIVDGDFMVSEMNLVSLRGVPGTINGTFDCSHNALTNLKHAPHTGVINFDCSHNQLVSLTHCPAVSDELVCDHNQLTDLHTCPPARLVYADYNPFTHFKNTPGHIHDLTITYQPEVPLLGLLSVHHVEVYDPNTGEMMQQLSDILNAHVGKGVFNKGLAIQCAAAMIRAGYRENARW